MLIGIVGKPSCGKSTFFKAATLAEVEIANYPFTTIKPNHAVGFVKIKCVDRAFGKQCNPREGYCLEGWRFVPVDLLDVAGLVPGAHEGKGLGNQFLDDLRQADVLIHVVDISGSVNQRGEPVTPLSYDPIKDITFLEYELDMWYAGILKKGWERFSRLVVQEKGNVIKAVAKQLSGLKVTEDMVKEAIEKLNLDVEKPTTWTEEQLTSIAIYLRKETKPMLIAANKIDVPGAEKNYEHLKQAFPDYLIIPCSADHEHALREAAKHGLIQYIPGESDFKILHPEKLNDKQKKALDIIKQRILNVFSSTGVQTILDKAVFEFLKYVAVFPGGVSKLEDQYGRTLPDCYLMAPKSTALDFAFKLHTDLGNHFIRAINVKTKKTIGKEYLLQQRDVIEIVSGK